MNLLDRLTYGRLRPALLRSKGAHEREIFRRFRGRVVFSGERPVTGRPLILLAFTNRSGSNLLAEYFRQTEKVAGGMEQLNHDVVANQTVAHPADSFPDYIAGLVTRLCPAGRSFCLKASWDQLLMLYRWNIPAMFSQTRIVHIQRQDAIAQAVSHSIAAQTRRWRSDQTDSGLAPAYLPDQIGQIFFDQRLANDTIILLSQIFEIPTLQITYEQITRNPDPHVLRALAFCGIRMENWSVRPTKLQRQADGTNAEFAARFRAGWRAALLPPSSGGRGVL